MTLKLPTDEIVEKYKSGLTVKEIAVIYNCSFVPITQRLSEAGIKTKKQKLDFLMSEIMDEYLTGKSACEIAIIYDCSPPTILNRLRKNGIKIRPKGESQTLNLPTTEIINEYLTGKNINDLAVLYIIVILEQLLNVSKIRVLKGGQQQNVTHYIYQLMKLVINI